MGETLTSRLTARDEQMLELYGLLPPADPEMSSEERMEQRDRAVRNQGLGPWLTTQVHQRARESAFADAPFETAKKKLPAAFVKHPIREQQHKQGYEYWAGLKKKFPTQFLMAEHRAWLGDKVTKNAYEAFARDFDRMSDEETSAYNEFLAALTEPKDRTGMEKTRVATKRAVSSVGENFAEFVTEFLARPLDEARIAAGGAEGLPTKRFARWNESEQIMRRHDPIEPVAKEGIGGMMSRGYYGMIASAPPMVIGGAGGPAVGIPYWISYIAPGRAREYRARGMSEDRAKVAGLVSAIPEAIVEFIGRVPGGQAIKKTLVGTAKELGGSMVKEWFEEPTQEAISRGVYALVAAGDPTAERPELKRELAAIAETAKESIFPVIGLMGLGGGARMAPTLAIEGGRAAGGALRGRTTVEPPTGGFPAETRRAGEFDLLAGATPAPRVSPLAPAIAPEFEPVTAEQAAQPFSKPELLTAEGATRFARIHPAEARTIAETEKPTRGQIKTLAGVRHSSATDRAEIRRLLRVELGLEQEVPRAEGIAREAEEAGPEERLDAPEPGRGVRPRDVAEDRGAEEAGEVAPVGPIIEVPPPAPGRVISGKLRGAQQTAEKAIRAIQAQPDVEGATDPPGGWDSLRGGEAAVFTIQMEFGSEGAWESALFDWFERNNVPAKVRNDMWEAREAVTQAELEKAGYEGPPEVTAAKRRLRAAKKKFDDAAAKFEKAYMAGKATVEDAHALDRASSRVEQRQAELRESGVVAPSAAERAQQEAEERPELAQFLSGPPDLLPVRQPARGDQLPDVVKVPRPAVEQRMESARGVDRVSLAVKVKVLATAAVHRITRAEEFIPKTVEFGSAHEFFRLLKEIPRSVGDEVNRTVAAIIDPLGPQQLAAFERKIIADNMVASIDRGEPLRFGFETREEVAAYRDQMDALVAQTPELQQALTTRRAVVGELVTDLVKADLLGEHVLKNVDTYFHQQVLMRLQAARMAGGVKARPVARAFQKKRATGVESLGEEYDYNTSYIEAEASWMTDAKIELEKVNRLKTLGARYDIMPELKAEAKDQDIDWKEALRERPGFGVWQPTPGNYFFRAFTIPEKLAEQLLAMREAGKTSILDKVTAEIDPEDLSTVLALGARRQQMVLPTPIIDQLTKLQKPQATGPLAQVGEEAMKGWKVWSLLNPKRALPYMIRNVTGDVDAVLAGAPGVLKFVPKATGELYRYHTGALALTPNLRRARDLGVVSSSMTAVEIPDLAEVSALRRFYKSKKTAARLLATPATAYFAKVKEANEYRENTLRYAAYLYYLKQLNVGKLTEYGGATKATVDALAKDMGNEVAAAHLSRNLLGDYGNLTVLGEYLRRHMIPFWSFQEVNLKRWPRLVINAFHQGKLKGGKSVVLGAAYTAMAMTQLGALYAGMWAWNNLLHRDEEDDLGEYDRQNPHINLGRNQDGTVRVFRNTGALGDFLEWFGINTLVSLYPKYRDKQMSAQDLLTETAKSPLNKVFQGLRPDLKGGLETLTGTSYFPDVLEPRRVPRGEAFTNIFGLRDEYMQFRGLVAEDGSRARPHYPQRYLVGVVDPRKNALYEIYDLRERYLKKKGKPRPPSFGISTFRNMRQAAMADDFEAFIEARQAYIAAGKSFKNFKASLRFLDPISARLNDRDEREFEQKFLTALQREKLQVARDYAQGLRVTLWKWWGDAFEAEQTPGPR